MREYGSTRDNRRYSRPGLIDVEELLAQAEKEYVENQSQRKHKPFIAETAVPIQDVNRTTKIHNNVDAHEEEPEQAETPPMLSKLPFSKLSFEKFSGDKARHMLQQAHDKYKSLPPVGRSSIVIGAAALTIATLGSFIVPSSDTDLDAIDFAELNDIPVDEARVSFANVPIAYGLGVGEGKDTISHFVSDNKKLTGEYTIDATKIDGLKYKEITSSMGTDEGEDAKLVKRMPSVYYVNDLATSIQRTGDDAIRIDGKNIIVNRHAFSIAAIDYEPGDINAPDDAYIGYDEIKISDSILESGVITQQSLDNLNLILDADPSVEGRQLHPNVTLAIGYLAQEVISNREWDCYKNVYKDADKAILAQMEVLIEKQTGDTFNAKRRVKFENDYQTPEQFYVANRLDGDADSALKTPNFIIDNDQLFDKAFVSCEVTTEPKDSK